LRKLADVLGVNVADLYQNSTLSIGPMSLSQVSATTIGGRLDLVRLTIDKMLPMRVAAELLALLAAGGSQEGDRPLEYAPEPLAPG
jgi:hypothetical protein